MASGIAFGKRHSAASPAFDVKIWMGRGPIRQNRLRAHHALRRRHICKQQTAFTALRGFCGQASNKQKFYHDINIPFFGKNAVERSDRTLQSVNYILTWLFTLKFDLKRTVFWHFRWQVPLIAVLGA